MKTTGREFNMLQDVITHFGEDPINRRSEEEGLYETYCVYSRQENKPNNIGCAIGMYLSDKVAEKLDRNDEGSIKDILKNPELKKLLPKWMLAIDPNFLEDIQILHDNDFIWNDKGLTEKGLDIVRMICKNYDLPFKKLKFPK